MRFCWVSVVLASAIHWMYCLRNDGLLDSKTAFAFAFCLSASVKAVGTSTAAAVFSFAGFRYFTPLSFNAINSSRYATSLFLAGSSDTSFTLSI